MTDSMDLSGLMSWLGRESRSTDLITAFPVRALTATLEAPYGVHGRAGEVLPPLWHWLYFLESHAESNLAADGHVEKGGFLPPVPLPRRMWAGSRFEFLRPLCIGDQAERISTIKAIQHKKGRSGELVFVTVGHEIRVQNDTCLFEEHDIVYREAPHAEVPPAPAVRAENGEWQRSILPNDVLLFRYSALTFNAHRIHYDRRYVTEVEGYPGLVVHGPLIATLLLDLLGRQLPTARVKTFDFRAVLPTFDGQPFQVHGRPRSDGRTVDLWASDGEGWLTMSAIATLG